MRPLMDTFKAQGGELMVLRVRALLVSAAIVAALGPLAAVQAQQAPDDETAAAIAHWRTATLARVDPTMHDFVAAMYADEAVDPSVMNAAAAAKQVAEQAALIDLSRSEQVVIQNYYSQVASDLTLNFRDTND